MKPERWQQIADLYHAVLERKAVERAAFIAEVCRDDEPLRRELESLVASHDHGGGEPVAAGAAQLLVDDEHDSLIGARIGHYTILSLLGQGGMGEVYLAQDATLGRQVALKLLPASVTTQEDRLRRFEQEARAASALNHPNILTIYEIGQSDARHFIATEYIEGETLRQHMAGGRLTPGGVLDITAQVASALAAAHAAGIVHRDIKPENIMVRRDGYVKVLDFGLAKLTEPSQRQPGRGGDAPPVAMVETELGLVMGTARYMSPEQARGLAVDGRTDIWSVGCVLYEMVAGRAPFEGATTTDVIVAILEREPVPLVRHVPNLAPELQRIVRKALRKERDERYQTAKDLAIDLKNLRRELEMEAERAYANQPAVSDGMPSGSGQPAGVAGAQPSAARPPEGAAAPQPATLPPSSPIEAGAPPEHAPELPSVQLDAAASGVAQQGVTTPDAAETKSRWVQTSYRALGAATVLTVIAVAGYTSFHRKRTELPVKTEAATARIPPPQVLTTGPERSTKNRPETPVPPVRPDASLRGFVNDFLAAGNSADVEHMLSFYADQVDYFDKGLVGRDYIRKDKQYYYRRWPQRNVVLDGDIAVLEGTTPTRTLVKFTSSYEVGSPQRHAHAVGTTESTLAIEPVEGTLKVVAQKETVRASKR